MTSKTTRRGFLRGSALLTAGAAAACSKATVPEGEAVRAPGIAGASEAAAETIGVDLEVNGASKKIQASGDRLALDVIRDELDLKGAKRSCGHGACGACAIDVDGRPVASCLMPAIHLHGRKVTTVEGLAAGDALHPVQRAFIGEDALQCGFCTPGFVVEAAAFYRTWRAENGRAEPSRAQISEALSGHLCRCGAYASIYRAVAAACRGDYDAPSSGAAGPRYDAREKVTGAARYTVDVALPGMAHAKILRSPVAAGTIRAIDTTPARRVPGVLAVVELTDASKAVRFVGQEILAIAAETEEAAIRACAAVVIDWDERPAVLSLEAALEEGAPVVFPRGKKNNPANHSEGPAAPARWDGNVRGPLKLFSHRRALARHTTREGHHVAAVDGRFRTQTQVHTCLEPHAIVASWRTKTKLDVWMSTQAVRHMGEDIAHRFGLEVKDVEVRADYIGGGFGSKATLRPETVAAVELSRVSGRPVRLALDRREEMTVAGVRPQVRTDVTAAISDVDDLALKVRAYADGGAAIGSATTPLMRLMYPQSRLDLHDYDVTTNTPPGCPFRGPGGPSAFFALESSIDALAHEAGLDPIAARRRWNRNPGRERVYDWADRLPAWRDRPPPQADRGRYRRGVGIAGAAWLYLTMPGSRVKLDADRGTITVTTASQDIGNGTRTILADVVSQGLGLDRARVDVDIGTSRAVHGPMSAGSRTACTVGPAAEDALAQLKEELVEVAATKLGMRRPWAVDAGVRDDSRFLAWAELLDVAPPISVIGKRRRDRGGFVSPPIQGLAIGRYLSAAAMVAEVEVDTLLGRVRVLNSHMGLSVGRIYTPTLARSQVEGGVIQGISYALYEERRLDPRRGFLVTAGLEDYRIAGIADVGEIHVDFIPGGFDNVEGKGIGIGEICTLPPLAAIANAVWHATGWRPRQTPLRPDRVLEGLRS